jgi:hypothetical protein
LLQPAAADAYLLFPNHSYPITNASRSGQAHADRWKTCADWIETPERVGPIVTPTGWQPGTVSRTKENVATSPFLVLDFDELDGRKPETPEELRQHIRASLAITRWLREALHWRVAAIVYTGGKSLHCWFQTPPPECVQSLKDSAEALGIDRTLIGRPEHPCRLPGQIHAETGRRSRVLWLQELKDNSLQNGTNPP